MYNVSTVFGLDPFRKDFIGFDNIFNEMDKFMKEDRVNAWPPYDIFTKNVGEETHTFIRLAVAGVKKENLSVKFDANTHVLEIKCDKAEKEEGVKYIHNGIAHRTFQISKTISPDLELVKASTTVEPGCLLIEFREKDKTEANDYIAIE